MYCQNHSKKGLMVNLLALLSCILKYVGFIIDRYNVHFIHSKGAWCFSHYSYVNKEFIQLGKLMINMQQLTATLWLHINSELKILLKQNI